MARALRKKYSVEKWEGKVDGKTLDGGGRGGLEQARNLILVSYFPVIVEAEVVGSLAVYDDATTARLADYLELYDNAGHLVVIRWFDGFAVERMAIDRGFLEDEGELEGVFVLVVEGVSA